MIYDSGRDGGKGQIIENNGHVVKEAKVLRGKS
jgi:hypothetical protein